MTAQENYELAVKRYAQHREECRQCKRYDEKPYADFYCEQRQALFSHMDRMYSHTVHGYPFGTRS